MAPERPETAPAGTAGRALVIVENLSVPFDRRVWQECRALRDAGWSVTVVCPRGTDRDAEPEAVVEGIAIHRFPFRPATGGIVSYVGEYAGAVLHCLRLGLGLGRFDVVHVCNPPDLLFLAALPLKLRGARLVFDQHDLVPELYLSRFGRGKDVVYRALQALEWITYRLSDVVIATNESYRRAAVGRGGKRPERVFVVRSAPDLTRFGPVEPDPALRRGAAHLLTYVGVMGPQDGVDHALRAIAVLRARGRDDFRAVFIGSGDAQPEMVRLSRELGLDDVVEFTGRVPDEVVVRHLSTADVCLLPDPKNPLNDVSSMNKVVEAMAMGKPMVSFDLVESRFSAGDAALYATDDSAEQFADAIARLLDDPALRAEMGARGRRRFLEHLSWERSARELVAAYATAKAARRR